MSDYQDVKVLGIDDATIVLAVREVHVDMAALHQLVGARARSSWKPGPRRRRDAAVFASFLLRDYGTPFARNAFCTELRGRTDWPPPTELIAGVAVDELTKIGVSSGGDPLYRARVAITVADPKLLKGFRARAGYSARACAGNPWERSHFLG
jgi:hypothetical protein